MNTQIQKGLVEPYRTARLPVQSEQDFWFKCLPELGLIDIQEECIFSARAMEGASKIFVSAKRATFLTATLEGAPPDEENTNSERIGRALRVPFACQCSWSETFC